VESNESVQTQEYQNNVVHKTASEMSVGEWLITMLIMIIPIVNIVMLFVWGFGNADPRRNYARASLIWMAISIVLVIIFYGAMFALFFNMSNY
jgi:ABC-type multidrug transport system permease subunit